MQALARALFFTDLNVYNRGNRHIMAAMHEKLSESHTVGEDTHRQIVRAEDSRHWLNACCRMWCRECRPPYRVVSTKLSGAYLHACLGGEGRMLLDGRWRPHREGMVTPARAWCCTPFMRFAGKRWQYCWGSATCPGLTPGSCHRAGMTRRWVRRTVDPRSALVCDPQAFTTRCTARRRHRRLHALDRPDRALRQTLHRPFAGNEERVEHTLDGGDRPIWWRAWTLDQLGAIAGISGEHLPAASARPVWAARPDGSS